MTRLLIALGFFALIASPVRAELYECTIANRAEATPRGIETYGAQDNWVTIIEKFTFDSDSGLMRLRGSMDPEKYTVLQKGGKNDNLAAIYQGAEVVTVPDETIYPHFEFLSIRVWDEGKPFLWFSFFGIFGGTCQPWTP